MLAHVCAVPCIPPTTVAMEESHSLLTPWPAHSHSIFFLIKVYYYQAWTIGLISGYKILWPESQISSELAHLCAAPCFPQTTVAWEESSSLLTPWLTGGRSLFFLIKVYYYQALTIGLISGHRIQRPETQISSALAHVCAAPCFPLTTVAWEESLSPLTPRLTGGRSIFFLIKFDYVQAWIMGVVSCCGGNFDYLI